VICCEHCKRILGVIQESEEINVIGEVKLSLFCPNCEKVSDCMLYEYNGNKRGKKRLQI